MFGLSSPECSPVTSVFGSKFGRRFVAAQLLFWVISLLISSTDGQVPQPVLASSGTTYARQPRNGWLHVWLIQPKAVLLPQQRRGEGITRRSLRGVEGHVQPEAVGLLPVHDLGDVSGRHPHRRAVRVATDPLGAVRVDGSGGRRGALVLDAPQVVREEDVVTWLLR
jgi:hypothetical protein